MGIVPQTSFTIKFLGWTANQTRHEIFPRFIDATLLAGEKTSVEEAAIKVFVRHIHAISESMKMQKQVVGESPITQKSYITSDWWNWMGNWYLKDRKIQKGDRGIKIGIEKNVTFPIRVGRWPRTADWPPGNSPRYQWMAVSGTKWEKDYYVHVAYLDQGISRRFEILREWPKQNSIHQNRNLTYWFVY